MKIERKKVNAKRFSSIPVGEVFEYDSNPYMKIESVDTDYNENYGVYDTIYNAVNLILGQLTQFEPNETVESLPDATLIV